VSIPSQFPRDPVVLSDRVQSLIPASAVAVEMREPGDASLLFPAETACLGRAVPKRVQEFAAGRLCARRALAEFGITGFALRVAPDRQPIWPDGIVGSITHTTGLCVAVAAERKHLLAIGVDSEVVGQAGIDIWPTICCASEADWVHSLSPSEQATAVTVLFSAKEAFYKCQYPLVGEWLDFHDLRIEPLSWGATRASFAVHALRPLRVARYAAAPVGQYLLHEGYVTAAVTLPPPRASQ
jgi:4'-phosphopantetheinyl transferase EntD